MASVFIGGSRAVSRLNPLIRQQLDNLISHKSLILIGDANGADKAVQQYFADKNYKDVVIYCMQSCRNNVGEWPTRPQTAQNPSKKDFEYYSTKDRAMARDADCGVMLWDGKSRGTLTNAMTLLSKGKKVLLYFSPRKTFQKILDQADLENFLHSCDPHHVDALFRKIGKPSLFENQHITMR